MSGHGTELNAEPLSSPDPVIEFYLVRVDRAAIREQLKKTAEERLEWLRRRSETTRLSAAPVAREEPSAQPPCQRKIDMGVDPARFADAAAVPLLVSDPVISRYLEDVDSGLIREALKLSVEERFERFTRLMESAYELRHPACRSVSMKGRWRMG